MKDATKTWSLLLNSIRPVSGSLIDRNVTLFNQDGIHLKTIRGSMNIKSGALFLAASMMISGLAFAQSADDKKWVAQCVKDNANEGAKDEVVLKYCKCMVDKMEESETRSVTRFEKANPASRKDCENKAGWK